MAWAALGKGLMGAGRVVGGAAKAAGGGARMARRMFKRKGGRDIDKPASQQTVDVEAQEVNRVRPSSALVPFAGGALAASASTSTGGSGDDVEEVALRIKTNLVDVEKLLKGSYTYREKVRDQEKNQREDAKRKKRENEIETKTTKKNKFKLPVPKEVRSFWSKIKDFLMKVFLAQFMDQILNMRGPLIKVLKFLAKAADIALTIIGWIFNILVTIVDTVYKLVDGMRGLVKNIFGEKGLETFDNFLGGLTKVLNAVISVAMVFAALGGVGMVTKLMAFLKGGSAIATATGLAGGVGGVGGVGGTAAQVGGMGAGATAGIVAGAGLLASGLGEGAGQLNKWGLEREKNWKKKAKDKWWTDPRKYFWAAAAGIMTILNRFFGVIGALLDIVGAPFRMIVELIRWPFLSEEDREKQRTNLAKYDARIREQLRQGLNAIDFLGLISDDKGSWGSLYGEQGTDEMGYTKDGKTKSQQVPAKKGMLLLSTPDLVATQDLLEGKKSGEKVHSIVKITSEGKDITDESKKPKGLWRAITGFADFMTGGIWDFDQRNRKGAPKDSGIRRIAGGLADYATLGITDFDKRGAGVMQVDPIFGGKDKAWGSPNEQAKRRENQSGFGLKRGMGGFTDFATFGMFDFDKQNPTGSPKGFGPFRMLAGLTDWMTMGLTDFDKRGAGNFQFDPISGGGDKRWGRERQRRQRPSTNYSYTDNYMKIAGERYIPGQALSERQYQVATMSMQMGNKYNDEVLRSYAMYEQQQGGNDVVIINRTSTVPIISEKSSEGGLYSNNTVIIDDGTSYASYQGH